MQITEETQAESKTETRQNYKGMAHDICANSLRNQNKECTVLCDRLNRSCHPNLSLYICKYCGISCVCNHC